MNNAPSVTLPRLIGHRGAAGLAPENTYAGLAKAAALGLSWVEVDVRLTRDDHLVLLHDDTLDRTTTGSGRVRDKTLMEISELRVGAGFGDDYAKETVPTVDGYLDQALNFEIGVNLEIKAIPGDAASTARRLGTLLAKRSTSPDMLVSSFLPAAMVAIQAAAPEVPRGFLRRRLRTGWRRAAVRVAASTIHLGARGLTKAAVDDAKGLGLPVAVYTVNDPAEARRLFSWGIDSLFTDRPDLLAHL